MTKACSKCGIEQTLDAFSPSKLGKCGRRSVCKACDRLKQAEVRARRGVPPPEDAPDSGLLSLPVETAPRRCGCPVQRIDGIKWELHKSDCHTIGLFNRIDRNARKTSSPLIEAGKVFGY